ncbi:excinuclease ABC subunit UvrA [Marinicella litoralis]|uniref:UvrABC system protein A n=1 Tax=Marinicella litoralis TaxID=644220 RepID=A0A4R6XC56_9GAMM|nr:excinuclease ABC subunit UvrA [Marinicella litoralis]TDR16796.1 excinuclease ABC subunit A [Marinicella litoralis]
MKTISLRGVRTHNLKNIDIDLPRDKFIVITGLSGSGKSSLAFDTIYAEGQRRYVESLSAYARQFLSMMDKPDLDHIEGLSPAISIEQKSTSHNPRSTVGTITEIYDYLRLLYARIGTPRCPDHGISLEAQEVSEMVDKVLALDEGRKLMLLAPVVRNRKGEHVLLLEQLRGSGFVRVRIDGAMYNIDDLPQLNPKQKHHIEAVVDRFKVKAGITQRLAESFETALSLSEGLAMVVSFDEAKDEEPIEMLFSSLFSCSVCNYSLSELEPRLFSFNSPNGACSECDGLGVSQFFDPERIILNKSLSMADGAVRGWDKRNGWYFQLLQAVAKNYDFDVNTPLEDLPQKIQDVLFFGSGDKNIKFTYYSDKGQYERNHPFEGIANNMKRRYQETESSMVREELNKYISKKACPSCEGQRLNRSARNVFINDVPLPKINALSIAGALKHFEEIKLTGQKAQIAEKIIKEIKERLSFLVNVGLNYLTVDRKADSLSGGEAQRIRLASQIGAGLVGVMYVLDEPSIGLHQRDNEKLLKTLVNLKNLGNTVIVVEHDEDAVRMADFVVDIGPGAGVHGGNIVAQGTPEQICNNPNSITGQYLTGKLKIDIPKKRLPVDKDKMFKLYGASGNNLKKVDIEIPTGLLTCITGVSGSGKSTLINETVYKVLANHLNRASHQAQKYERFENIDLFDKVVDIDQKPIGRTPRSNPATYTQLFGPIRDLFSNTPEARTRGYKPGRFSFNVKGGRCEACQGDGLLKVEMHFLPDVYVTCDTCKGKRYNRETLDVQYKGKNIYQVLNMTVEDALPFFSAIPTIATKLQTLLDVGLSYITLGQNATTLSGGEAQRVKLAKELSKRDTGKTVYILDEPTTGLHFADIKQLLKVLHRLRDNGNTIMVIEHNLDVIKTADWVIDLGPEGGNGGGEIIATGTPEDLVKVKKSHTGAFLKSVLAKD